MQCVVTGGNVKVLGKALHSLSRIGDELYVEPQEDGLALRSVNSSRSAYACFLFAPLFFSRYSIPSGLNFRCKMAIKLYISLKRLPQMLEDIGPLLVSRRPKDKRYVSVPYLNAVVHGWSQEVVVISVKPLSFLLQIVAANLTEYNLPFYTYSVLTVFRSLATLEKTVEKCHISLDEQKDRLTFTLHCKHGLLKTHNLSYQDSESLEAVFDKDNCANVFRAQPRVLVDTVVHFTTSLEEVTVTVSDERMWVRNHVEDDAERSKAMLTELCLAADEFDHFAVKSHNSITFCLKEFRGLLLFAESTGLPVSMYLDEPGSPVVLSVTDSVLEGNFVLATLSDDHSLHKSNRGADAEQLQPPDDFMNDDMDAYLIAMDTSVAPGPSTADAPTSSLATSRKPPAPNYRTRTYSEEEENGEEDPGRPPDKKFRSLFFGSVLPPSPQMSTQPVTSQEVLASDSEDETEAE